MEVSIISRETIKPSSPTPPHLKTFKVSLLDKVCKSGCVHFTTYYSIEHLYEVDHDRIKLALAQTLTQFYPLAGRHADVNTIDCNDKGALFVTAHVNCPLNHLLNHPKLEELHTLRPPWPSTCPEEEGSDAPPAQICIQLNVFECGGIALSVLVSHFTSDACSVIAFMKCWSEISRVDCQDQIAYPLFPGAELFPTDDEDDDDAVKRLCDTIYKSLAGEGKCLMQRFVFDKVSIHALREKARCKDVPNPSRVEAVSMFVWKHCMDASNRVWGVREPSIMTILSDLRRRVAPILSENSFGNILLHSMIHTLNKGMDDDISGLVRSFRSAIQDLVKIKQTLMENKGGGLVAFLQFIEKRGKYKEADRNPYILTSWCKLGFTDIDFGWGKPVWFSPSGMDEIPSVYKNVMMLVDGNGGENIELWIYLEARGMNELENNQEFLAYASPNPPILIS